MSEMVLGSYTFAEAPGGMTIIQKDRDVAYRKTYSSVAFFSWGVTYKGKIIELFWNILSTAQYASLLGLYVADAEVVFDPQDGLSKTFNVEIVSLDGEYRFHLNDASGHIRENVKMQLLIKSEV